MFRADIPKSQRHHAPRKMYHRLRYFYSYIFFFIVFFTSVYCSRRHGRKQKSVLVHIEQNNRGPVELIVPEFELRRRERTRGEFQSNGIAVRLGHDQLL